MSSDLQCSRSEPGDRPGPAVNTACPQTLGGTLGPRPITFELLFDFSGESS